jgi:hypothetical protein
MLFRVNYFDLSGDRLTSLSRREQDQARGPLLAESARRQEVARAAQVATKPRVTMPKVFVALGSQ